MYPNWIRELVQFAMLSHACDAMRLVPFLSRYSGRWDEQSYDVN